MATLSGRNKILAGAVTALILWFFVGLGMYKLGAWGQNKRIANLGARLDVETKKASENYEQWTLLEKNSEKLKVKLEEKDAEIAAKVVALERCEAKAAQLSKPKQVAKRPVALKSAVQVVVAKASEKKEAPAPIPGPVPIPAPAPVPTPAQIAIPAVATTPQLVLRINIVEWSPVFAGKSLLSRDIGPVVRQWLADGTVIRAKETLGFTVNGAAVSVQNGSAIINPGQVSPATALVIRPVDGAKFASPPNGLPFTTNPGELYGVVQNGVSEIWLNFILKGGAAPAAPPPPSEKKNLGGPKGPPIPYFVSIK